jgi:hypothetical protein
VRASLCYLHTMQVDWSRSSHAGQPI